MLKCQQQKASSTSAWAASCLILQLFLFSCVLSCFTHFCPLSCPFMLPSASSHLIALFPLVWCILFHLFALCGIIPTPLFAVGLTPASDLCLVLHPEALLFFPPLPQPQASSAVFASGSCVTLGSVPNMTPRSDAV